MIEARKQERTRNEGVGRNGKRKREKHDSGMRRSSKGRRSNEQECRRNDDYPVKQENRPHPSAQPVLTPSQPYRRHRPADMYKKASKAEPEIHADEKPMRTTHAAGTPKQHRPARLVG